MTNEADKADVTDKPAKAEEVDTVGTPDIADKAKANEANKAIVINKDIGAKETNESKANAIDKIVATNEAIVFHEVISVDAADVVSKANELMRLIRPT